MKNRPTYPAFARAFAYRRTGMRDLRIASAPPYAGDCRTYAITTAWIMSGHNEARMAWQILICRHVLWFCISSAGQLHVASWRPGTGWACNVFRDWGRCRHWPLLPLSPVPIAMLVAVLIWFGIV